MNIQQCVAKATKTHPKAKRNLAMGLMALVLASVATSQTVYSQYGASTEGSNPGETFIAIQSECPQYAIVPATSVSGGAGPLSPEKLQEFEDSEEGGGGAASFNSNPLGLPLGNGPGFGICVCITAAYESHDEQTPAECPTCETESDCNTAKCIEVPWTDPDGDGVPWGVDGDEDYPQE